MSGNGTDDPDPDAPDYYGLVGVTRDASQETVESALTRAKAVYHPDQSSLDDRTASRCFDRVRDAESVLTDPERRSAYDTFIERFGPAEGHEAYERWQDSGRRVDPAEWDPAGTTTTREASTAADTARSSTAQPGRGSTDGTSASSGATETRGRAASTTGQQTTSTPGEKRGESGRANDHQQADRGAKTRQGDWRGRGPVGRRLSVLRRRVTQGRLSVFLPVVVLLNRGVDVAAGPGVQIRRNISIPAQFGLTAVLTIGAYLAVGFTDSLIGPLTALLWVVSSIVLYAAGGALWLFAAVVTYATEGTGRPFYTALVMLAVVATYTLVVRRKTDREADETGTG